MPAKTQLQRALTTLVHSSTCDRHTVLEVLLEVTSRHITRTPPNKRLGTKERQAAHHALAGFLELTHEQDVSDHLRTQKLHNMLEPHNTPCPAAD